MAKYERQNFYDGLVLKSSHLILIEDALIETQNELSNASKNGHAHDDRYYTETEIDSKLNGKSDTSHNHDSRYYTETEIDSKLNEKAAINHASDSTGYGIGTGSKYGHVKLTDSVSSTSAASSGVAASAKAVKTVNDKLGDQVTYSLSGTTLTITTK